MRFIIGLLLGLGVGFAAALLLAPDRGALRREEEGKGGEEAGPEGESAFGVNHDTMAALRRTMRSLQRQVQEAWEEAGKAAEEAEREMRARYERSLSRGRR